MTEPHAPDPTGYFREVIVEMTSIPLEQVRQHIEQRLGQVEAKLADLDVRTAASNRKADKALSASDKATAQLIGIAGGVGRLETGASAIDERLSGLESAIGTLASLVDLGDGRNLAAIVRQVEADRTSVDSRLTSVEAALDELRTSASAQSERLLQVDARFTETRASIQQSQDSLTALAGDLGSVRRALSPLERIEGVEKALALSSTGQTDSAAAMRNLVTDLELRNQKRDRLTQILLAALIVLVVAVGVLQIIGR